MSVLGTLRSMKSRPPSVWSDTPPTSERIVTGISRIAAALRAAVWQFATAEGLNPTQTEILERLLTRDEGVRLSWLAQQLGVSSASASDSIAALVTKGLVEKNAVPDDGRAVALKLTAAGRALAKKFSQAMAFAFDAVDELPEQTQEALFTSLLAMMGKLQQAERFPEIRACATCKHFAPNVHPDAQAPHHCRFVDVPMPQTMLRLDCPEHDPASPAVARRNWRQVGQV